MSLFLPLGDQNTDNGRLSSTDEQFRAYIKSNYLNGSSDADVGDLFELYPDDPTQGSPFDTGDQWETGQYKRLAAIQGDIAFQAPRRFFLNNTSGRQPTWSFCA